MKQKIIIGFSILLLIVVLLFIARDLFVGSGTSVDNPNEYNLDKLKTIDDSLIHYKEIRHIKPAMSHLSGIAIDNNSMVYVVGAKEVQVFDQKWEKKLSFYIDSAIQCVAVGSQNEIYLGVGNHIEKYDTKGVKMKQWEAYSENGFITSIAVSDKFVYVADAGSRLVIQYDINGNLINIIGKKDKAKGIDGFTIPSMYFDVAIGLFDDLWVVNPGMHEIRNYTDKGVFRSAWGEASMQLEGFAGCCNPAHFAVMNNGFFVTYEKGMDRIKLYDQSGKFKCVVAGPQNFGGKSDYNCSFATMITDLAVDPQGLIYTLDPTTHGIRVFEKK